MTLIRNSLSISFATTVAAALMCRAMTLPAAAQDANPAANGEPGADANGAMGPPDMNDQGAMPAHPDMNANPNQANPNQPGDDQANPSQANPDQAAPDQPGDDQSGGSQSNGPADPNQAGLSGNNSQAMARNEAVLRQTGGDTSQPYSNATRAKDDQKEAGITAQLNQKQEELNESASSGAGLR